MQIETSSRSVLGLSPVPELMALPDPELAKLLYRDSISLKHASRDRLNKELHDKMEQSAPVSQQPALRDDQEQRGALSKALVQYLLKVGWGQ